MVLSFALALVLPEAYAQQSPPLREENVIKSKLFFIKNDLDEGTSFLANFKNIFGSTAEKHEKHRLVSEQILSKELEISAKKNKSGQEKSFLKIVPCLKELMSVKYKSSGWDADNLADCYLANKVNPNIFHQSVDGKRLYNKTQIHQAGDELSKLIDSIEDNTPTKETYGMFKNYLNALEEKKKLEGGLLDKLKQKENFYQQEYVYRKKVEFKVDMKMKSPCGAESIPDLGRFPDNKSNTEFASEASKDLLKSFNKELESSFHNDPSKDVKDICSIFNEMANTGDKINGSDETCKDETTVLEKIIQLNQVNIKEEVKTKKLNGISCLASPVSSFVSGNDQTNGLKKLQKIIYMNLVQGLAVGAKMNNSYSTVVGIKEISGACGYLIRDYSKKDLTWVSEKDFLEKLQEINTLTRDSRPEDIME
jgi:hypothetical protein